MSKILGIHVVYGFNLEFFYAVEAIKDLGEEILPQYINGK